MKNLKLEFFKCRRRGVLPVCLGLLAAQFVWMGVFLAREEPPAPDGWKLLLYNLPLVDAILLPLTAAVLASRSGETEHKGSALKLLETMATPGQLYAAKFFWGALVLAGVLLVRSAAFMLLGFELGYGQPPFLRWAAFTLLSWVVSLVLYALQQGLSLRFANQAPALIAGLSGSFLGLLSLLFPLGVQRCLPWGYYGLMLLVRMEWDPVTRATSFFWREPEALDLGLLCLWGGLFLLAGGALFVKKEV